MLEPDSRAALTEQLRPPSGFQLAHAVATTFTLDLTAALSIPLAFAAHRVRESRDPIAILDAVRRAADKIDVFAQAGQVAEPRVTSDLFALLEPMIHPVQAPRRNLLFHPKVWILEYADGDARSYRMLCASRNLTNDRSWDLVVRLDGLATDRPTEQSAPLAALVRALPAMCVQPLAPSRVVRIAALADAVATVEWERPVDVRSLRFHPFGVPGIPTRPLQELFSGVRHGIISPFVSDDGLARILPPQSNVTTVLARREQLDRLSAASLSRIEGLSLTRPPMTTRAPRVRFRSPLRMGPLDLSLLSLSPVCTQKRLLLTGSRVRTSTWGRPTQPHPRSAETWNCSSNSKAHAPSWGWPRSSANNRRCECSRSLINPPVVRTPPPTNWRTTHSNRLCVSWRPVGTLRKSSPRKPRVSALLATGVTPPRSIGFASQQTPRCTYQMGWTRGFPY